MGATFGHYRHIHLIGTGVMANVFEAEDTRTGARVAMKLITQHKAGGSLDLYLARLEQEAACLEALKQGRVPTFIEYVETNAHGYIIMELFKGGMTLSHLLRQEGKLPRERSLNIALEIAQVIAQANALGIIHRDIKPDNIYVLERGKGSIRVLDFGISIPPSHRRRTYTSPGRFMGTPAYASPHHAEHSSRADSRDEAWSISAILYLMLTGTHAYPQEQAEDVMRAIRSKVLPPRKDLADDTWDIIKRGLAADRNEQYASVADLQKALECTLSGEDRPPVVAPTPPSSGTQPRYLAIAVLAMLVMVGLSVIYHFH
jgi:serine/threonine-protein kinase